MSDDAVVYPWMLLRVRVGVVNFSLETASSLFTPNIDCATFSSRITGNRVGQQQSLWTCQNHYVLVNTGKMKSSERSPSLHRNRHQVLDQYQFKISFDPTS